MKSLTESVTGGADSFFNVADFLSLKLNQAPSKLRFSWTFGKKSGGKYFQMHWKDFHKLSQYFFKSS